MRFTYQPGNQPLHGYTIQRGIHHGGFGEVYLARSEGGKDVALKLVRHTDQEIEIRGVTQCLNLKHPNLVNLFDVKADSHGDRWVVMEYVGGSSLEDVLAAFPNGLPLNEVREWLHGLVQGVAFLHSQGIVHRDLKPANVYRENGIVKVGDVGLSKQLQEKQRKQTQSVGTVYYMAPEVSRGQYGPEVDVYSLGVILFELIAGKLPFNGETAGEILMKHLVAQPDLSSIPKNFRPMLSRALEKDPAKRTASVRQLEADFVRSLEGRSEATPIPESAFVQRTVNSPPLPKENRESPRFRRTLPAEKPRTVQQPRSWRKRTRRLLVVILAVVAFIYFTRSGHWDVSNFSMRSVLGISLIAAVFASLSIRQSGLSNSLASGASSSSQDPDGNRRWYSSVSRTISLLTPGNAQFAQQTSIRYRLQSLGGSLTTAALISSLLAAGVFLSLETIHRSSMMPSLAHGAFFAAISVLGCGLLLATNAWVEIAGLTRFESRLARVAVGILLGTVAYYLDDFLYISVPPPAYFSTHTTFRSIGVRPLTTSNLDPTWLGYCWFFAAFFGLRRWSREMDPQRKAAFSITTLFGAMLTAYLLSLVFRFPQYYALLWSTVFSVALQITSRFESNGMHQGADKCR